jgi:hypothetical protein
MEKRNFASVTDVPCTCSFLERSARDPSLPIVYDQESNEYHIEFEARGKVTGTGSLMIYHCPFCGGTAPKSQRDKLFAVIPRDEADRLYELFSNIKTLDEVLQQFGEATFDLPDGDGTERPEKGGKPPAIERFRTLVYSNLSEVADVRVTDYHKDRVHVTLVGKYIGKPQTKGGA